MKKVLLLAGNTFRARGYSQILSKRKDINLVGLFYGFEVENIQPPKLNSTTVAFFKKNKLSLSNLEKSAILTFQQNNIDYINTPTKDVNSKEVLNLIKQQDVDYIIYAGYGGQILSKDHFDNKTKYLHAHPGLIPEERGSTTIYYSILNRNQCGVSVFFMNDKIDAGKVVHRKNYNSPSKGVDIDIWYDNIIRADCLNESLDILLEDNYKAKEQVGEHEDYFIIHPLLKHMAILSLKTI